ncbi:ABC transporter permease [Rhodococcus pyridinivorans]|uniref:Peptide ABC transporter permease n=1 Tax=Rhodococcus pyridinivorans SB3094 TaxID=1435356 RepID=V9XE95_9NOCA|nr:MULTISPECIES: ABC transporter permease [Rhodococcus]AHD21023.1 peptide ABC transporter permease [Rhodococcus pyridinivorans SB3094]AHD21751.1 peptide ABC transporter permease [Rhodococcus pyridinivorans SB3094]MCT7292655.1 ABC transporter permease [Rhodococcus sp. PAE-6]USI89491.1 ABC transporter permease [Rhodococcus pyridinivorans]UTM36407.1 ABC transporter permease [Rhodococcus pyridinivorans]
MSDTLVRETLPATPLPEPHSRRRIRITSVAAGVRRNAVLVVSSIVLLLAVGFALFPSLFASGDPLQGVPAEKLQGPSVAHWFGTDNLGRDVYTRVVHGSGLSLTATLVAVGLALVVGSLIGLLSGAVGGAIDAALMRLVDVLLSIPALLLSLALVTALGFGTMNVAIAVGVSLVANFARVMRSEVLRVRKALYVEAAFACGVRWHTVLRRHVLRNSYAPVAALAAVEFGMAVLAVSSLSFLGFGAVPPTPEWGSLISEGRNYLAAAWWMTTLPGLVIVAIVLSAHRIGHALEDRSAR